VPIKAFFLYEILCNEWGKRHSVKPMSGITPHAVYKMGKKLMFKVIWA